MGCFGSADRFYTGAISGLQIFTDGASAGDFSCIYNQQEFDILGTTAHTCTFHSEGYRWLEPTTDPRAERLSEVCGEGGVCNFASGAVGQLQGDSPDDGYFYMDLVRAATLGSARAVTVAATRPRAVAANRSRWGSAFPSWGGRRRSSTSRPTATSPSLVSTQPYSVPTATLLSQRCINACAGPQTGESGQASNPETTTIPSAGSKPDDAIFAYWTGKT